MKKEKMDERTKEILERGGLISPVDFEYLEKHLNYTAGIADFYCFLRSYYIFYIPEYRGYVTIYRYSGSYPDATRDFKEMDALFAEKDMKKVNEMLRERRKFFYESGPASHRHITELYRAFTYPRDGEMVFHDLTYWKSFATFHELKVDYLENGVPYFMEDPMNDPEFRAIIERGTMMDIEDYHVILRHCNYIDYKNMHHDGKDGRPSYDYVVERPHDSISNERISIIMDSWEFDPARGIEEVCCFHGGFKYEDSQGNIIKDYDREELHVSTRSHPCTPPIYY